MLEAIEAIEKETDRSEAIVERIRTYVREHKRRLKSCPWDILIDDAIASFKTSSRIPIPVRWINKTDGRVLTDPFEMELVIVNLLRNSAQAQSSIDQPKRTQLMPCHYGQWAQTAKGSPAGARRQLRFRQTTRIRHGFDGCSIHHRITKWNHDAFIESARRTCRNH